MLTNPGNPRSKAVLLSCACKDSSSFDPQTMEGEAAKNEAAAEFFRKSLRV